MSRWTPKVKTIDALERGLIVLDEVRATQGASLQELHGILRGLSTEGANQPGHPASFSTAVLEETA